MTTAVNRATHVIGFLGMAAVLIAELATPAGATTIRAAHEDDSAMVVAAIAAQGKTQGVARSVGLMTGAPGEASPLQAVGEPEVVSRSVGLMIGTAGVDSPLQASAGDQVEVSRSVGLMTGAPASATDPSFAEVAQTAP